VTGGGSRIAWTDEGPIVERVRGMLVAAGIEARRCDGELRLFMLDHEIRFDRFNLAERKHFGPHHISLIMPRRHGLRRSLNPDQ
jgi:hypothetical protein